MRLKEDCKKKLILYLADSLQQEVLYIRFKIANEIIKSKAEPATNRKKDC